MQIVSGRQLKDNVHRLLGARRKALIRAGRRILLETLLARGRATADDVRERLVIPAGIDPKLCGAIPGPLAKLGLIEADGFAESTRRKAHARLNRIWRLNDTAAAQQWLQSHPPLEAPEASSESTTLN